MNTLAEGESLVFPQPRPFAARCARWLAAALAVIGLLWLLGFEAVLYRAAPLHARPDAILQDLRVLPSVAVMMALAAMLLRRTAVYPPAAIPPKLALATLAGAVLLGAAWALDPEPLPLLAYHALAVAVFTVGMGAMLNAAAYIRLPAHEPAAIQARALLPGIVLFAFVFAGSMAMLRGGAAGLEALASHPPLAFIDDLDKVGSPYALFRDFAAMHPGLSGQARLYPPGALLMVWSAAVLVADSPLGIVLMLMAFAALAVLPLYGWVAAMTSRRTALIAAMLYSVVPGVTLFASGSVDAAFAPLTLTALYAFTRAIREHRLPWAVTAGALFAAATLMHFALLTLAYWFVLAGILHGTRDGAPRAVLRAWFGLGLGCLAVHAIVLVVTGFHYAESFRMAWDSVHASGLDTPRAAWYWWPVLTALALLFYAGIPVVLLTLRAVRHLPNAGRALARCSALAFAGMALTYLGMGEGERAAYYAYPFLVLPAALLLEDTARRSRSMALPFTAMALCALQAWLLQSYFQV